MRRRITGVAVLVAGLMLLLAGALIVSIAEGRLAENLDRSLEQRAEQIEAAIESDPAVALVTSNDLDRFAQIVDADGRVVASTSNVAGLGPLGPLPVARLATSTRHDLPIEDDDYRVLVRRFEVDGTARFVIVGENVDDLRDDVWAMVTSLLLVLPIALAALGTLVWWLVGRTLRPVERIRSEVAGIGLDELDHRVPALGSGDEVDRLAQTMNEMLARLEGASTAQRRFVGDASHELRTPLTRLRTALEVDLADPTPDHARTIRSALEDTIEMQQLVDDLLLLARHEVGAASIPDRPVDLDVIVTGEVAARRSDARVPISTADVGACQVRGDEAQLARMVGNLVSNAVRHAATRVQVSVTESDGEIVLAVADDGAGIPVADRERVFDRFVRLDEARSADAGGSGLGLAIVRGIARRHGGDVAIEDVPTGGASVVVRFPSWAESGGPGTSEAPPSSERRPTGS